MSTRHDASSRAVFLNARLVLPSRIVTGSLVTEGNAIREVREGGEPPGVSGARHIDANGLYLSPGFVDIHTHGAGGADFMDGTEEAVRTACLTHLRHGTTSIVPTTLASTFDEMAMILGLVERIMEEAKAGEKSSADVMPDILGIHVEGPYFSPAQRGAQDPKYLKNPDPAEYQQILDAHPGIVRWTTAPELPGALEMGRELRRRGVVASIGHSDAVYEEVVEACRNGYSLVTHLYNGMSRLVRKNAVMRPGVAESGLILDELDVEVIADGMHLPPSLLTLVYKVKGPDRICLVTDSMRADRPAGRAEHPGKQSERQARAGAGRRGLASRQVVLCRQRGNCGQAGSDGDAGGGRCPAGSGPDDDPHARPGDGRAGEKGKPGAGKGRRHRPVRR